MHNYPSVSVPPLLFTMAYQMFINLWVSPLTFCPFGWAVLQALYLPTIYIYIVSKHQCLLMQQKPILPHCPLNISDGYINLYIDGYIWNPSPSGSGILGGASEEYTNSITQY